MALPEPRMKYIDGLGPRMAYEMVCAGCGKAHVVARQGTMKRTDKESSYRADEGRVYRSLDASGWTYKSGLRQVHCEECTTKQKNVSRFPSASERNRAAAEALFTPRLVAAQQPEPEGPPSDVANTEQISITDMPPPEEEEMAEAAIAVAPREPTISDRRRIADALDDKYDTANGRYFGEASDGSVAAALKVPKKWVSDIRLMLYGEGDSNEEATEAALKISEAERRLSILESQVEAILGEIEALKADVGRASKSLKR